MVARRQEGNAVYYSIADEKILELCDQVCEMVRERLETKAGALGGRLRA